MATSHKRGTFVWYMLTLNQEFVKAFGDCSDFCYNPDHFHVR